MCDIYRTGHQIADTVADALAEGFNGFPECNAAIVMGFCAVWRNRYASTDRWFLVDSRFILSRPFQWLITA